MEWKIWKGTVGVIERSEHMQRSGSGFWLRSDPAEVSLSLRALTSKPVERVLIDRATAPAQRAHPHRVLTSTASQTVVGRRVPVDGGDRTAAGVRRETLQR